LPAVASIRFAAIFWGILFLLCRSLAEGQTTQSITLAWDIDTDPTVVGYNLNYGTSADSLTQVQNVGDLTTAKVSGLTAGVTYYFAVTAYDADGVNSAYSNEVSLTLAAAPTPTPTRIPTRTPRPTRASPTPAVSLISPVADFNGDHHSDLLWRNSQSGDVAIWLLDGTSVVQMPVIADVPLNWKIIGLADMNGDGKTDILWHDTNSPGQGYAVWYMNGVSVVSTQLFSLPVNSPVVFFADLDGNGTVDAVEYDPDSGAVVICPNTGALTFYAAYRYTISNVWALVGLADLNGDGHHELIFRNQSTGEVGAWYLTNFQLSSGVNLGTPALNWRLRGIGKFNANPSDAFVWHDSNTGTIAIWNFNSAGQFSSSFPGAAPYPWEIYGAGNSEILWYNLSTSQCAVWSVNGSAATGSAINIFPGPTWLVQPFSN
jgi:hypothetical protein